ncbi:hypothetical protein IJD44_07585 [bacterium]|nr:hypothetical protein [bacterium]
MSAFTKFLNLFKWQPDIDGDEEFDIDKSLNENWDKIDTKLETYMTELSNDVEVFKNNTNTQVEDIANQVSGLREISISPTQPTSNESVWIKKGKNLYNPKNAYITGTLSQNIGLIYSNIKVGQTYTFSANNYSWVSIKAYNSSNQIIRELGNTETTKNVTITIQDTEVYIELMFFSGVNNLNSINNVDFTKVQLEQNLTATDFEEFVEEKILIKNNAGIFEEYSDVAISPVMPTQGKVWIKNRKNEFDKRNLEIVEHWNVNYTVDDNKKITVTVPQVTQAVAYIKTSNFVIPEGQHTISLKIEGQLNTMKLINAHNTDICIKDTNENTFTVDLAEDTTVFIYFYIDSSSTANTLTIENIQIEKGNTATDYEDYVEKEIYVKNEKGVFERFYSESELNKQDYSTEEQKIGTWNGKNVYRKIFTGNNPDVTGWQAIADLSDLNIDDIINLTGIIKNTMSDLRVLNVNTYENENYNCSVSYFGLTKALEMKVTGWTYNTHGFVYRIILEYTKTTD